MNPLPMESPAQTIRELQLRLQEAEEALHALRHGEVDAILVAGPDGDRVFTLKGADEAYRVIVEQMAEGALTLTRDGLILFSNQQFASIAEARLENIIGARFQEFVSPEDAYVVAALLVGCRNKKFEIRLRTHEGKTIPVYVSVTTLVLDQTECVCLIVTDLTEQKRNEQIVTRGRLARSILDQAAGAILVVEPGGTIIQASRGAESLAGTPVLLQPFDCVFPVNADSPVSGFEQILSMVRDRGSIADLEIGIHTQRSSMRSVLTNAALLTGTAGEVLGCTIVLSDITGRKATEKALIESEHRYRSLFENSLDAVFLTRKNGDIAAANPAACKLFGMTAEEICRRGQSGLTVTIDPKFYKPLSERSHGELIFTRQQGDGFLGEFSSVSIDDGGRAFLIVRDITTRRKAENDLRESEERYRQLIEANPMGVASGLVADNQQGVVCTANAALLTMLGYSRQDIANRIVHWADLGPAESVARDVAAIGEARDSGFSRPFERELLRKDGSRLPAMAAFAVVGAEREIAVAFFADLTEQKRAEQQLVQAQKLDSVGLLAGGIAHDFNNLLTAIMGQASLVAEEATGALAESAREIVLCAGKASHLTRQLLAYSGKGEFIVKDLDLSREVREIVQLLRMSIPKSVEVRLDLRDDLPLVAMDPGQVQQVVMNLVINAGEAIGDKAGGRIAVVTNYRDFDEGIVDANGSTAPAGRYVWLEVEDTGSGIEDAAKPRIFDPFFTSKFTGRGLGLAAVSGIVRSQKGAITVASRPGEGSRFRIYFPAAPTARPATVPAPGGAAPQTILVVDDEDPVRRAIAAVLRKRGYRVVEACDGKEALLICEREQGALALVVVDLVMPVMGGREFLAELELHRPGMKVLLTSGYGKSEAALLCDSYKQVAFLQKPYTAQELADVVAKLMEPAIRTRAAG